MTIEVQCTSCHTRYRIDEQVLPEGTPTFKCSRCGHVFNLEPREAKRVEQRARAARQPRVSSASARPNPALYGAARAHGSDGWVVDDEPPIASRAARSIEGPAGDPSETPTRAESEGEREEPIRAGGAGDSPAQSGEASEARTPTEDLIWKPFRSEDEPAQPAGENLKFDFNDEKLGPTEPMAEAAETEAPRDTGGWSVGEHDFDSRPAREAAEPIPPLAAPELEPAEAEPPPRAASARVRRKAKAVADSEFFDETAAPIYNHGVTHSARFMLGLFALIAGAYGVTTMLIRSAPATAAEVFSRLPLVGARFEQPLQPARLVALRDVHSDYLHTKGGHQALVITGIAENVGGAPLHSIQIAASLRDAARRRLAAQAVYCGNNLSASTVGQMTPHELEFFEKLDPPKNFALDPAATSPFVIVFVDPPASINRYEITVARAAAAEAPSDSSGA